MKLAIQHFEPNTMGLGLPDSLFYITDPETIPLAGGTFPIILPNGTKIQTGTLRNSLYTKCLRHTKAEYTLHLEIIAQGSFTLNIFSQSTTGVIQKILVKRLTNISGSCRIPFAVIPGNTSIARYFFEIESRGAVISSVFFSVDLPDAFIRKTIFLIRTYGNTAGIISSLNRTLDYRFWEGVNDSRETFLRNTSFCIYDSTPNCEKILKERLPHLNFDCSAWIGPNLGGGGNASLNLYLAKAYSTSESIDSDYVILDDDVCASPETLYRVFALNQIRDPSLTFGSPIFMHSEPQRLWENGGLWGKEFSHGLTVLTSVTPQLNQHGLYFEKYENLNSFLVESPIDYTTFNLFSFSSETHAQIGYPAAFFLRGDDIDFSLRCRQNGILATSPTLAVWQEPAHSYWQEYMAFMHGIIINIVHGEWSCSQIASIIQDRILEHALHNDLFGVKLYSMIAEDLISSSLLLSPRFADLYLQRKKDLAIFERCFEMRANPHNAIASQQIQIISFLHPSISPDHSKPFVALHWPSKKSYYIYDRRSSELRISVAESTTKSIAILNDSSSAFLEAVETLKNRYLKTTTEDFWNSTLDQYEYHLAYSSTYEHETYQSDSSEVEANCYSLDNTRGNLMDINPESAEHLILKETFDAQRYLEINPDVASAGIDPLDHYIRYGRNEGRRWV